VKRGKKEQRTFKVWVPHNIVELIRAYHVGQFGTRQWHMNDPAGFKAVRATLTLAAPNGRKGRSEPR